MWFGYPLEIVSDRGKHFLNDVVSDITSRYLIKHRKAKEDLWKHRAKYYCATSELFHVTGKWGTPQSPMRMAMAHKHTIKSESYSMGMLAKKIYRMDATSTLFQ